MEHSERSALVCAGSGGRVAFQCKQELIEIARRTPVLVGLVAAGCQERIEGTCEDNREKGGSFWRWRAGPITSIWSWGVWSSMSATQGLQQCQKGSTSVQLRRALLALARSAVPADAPLSSLGQTWRARCANSP